MARKVSDELAEALGEPDGAGALFDALADGAQPWDDFYVTPALGRAAEDRRHSLLRRCFRVYLRARKPLPSAILGPFLGRAIRSEAEARGFDILEAGEGIRATVIGASQYTVQLSGETIFVPDSLHLPVRNLRVFVVHVRLAGAGDRAD